jgi:hypothetical protein
MGWADVGDGSFSRAPGSGAEDLSAKSKERTTEPHEEGSKKKEKNTGGLEHATFGLSARHVDYHSTILPSEEIEKLVNKKSKFGF